MTEIFRQSSSKVGLNITLERKPRGGGSASVSTENNSFCVILVLRVRFIQATRAEYFRIHHYCWIPMHMWKTQPSFFGMF